MRPLNFISWLASTRKIGYLPILIIALCICLAGCYSDGVFFSEFLPKHINDAGDFFKAWIILSLILTFWNLWDFMIGIIATIILFIICIFNYGFGMALLLSITGNIMGFAFAFILKFIYFRINKK